MAVHFTKQQIDEIEQALIARSKRDSQFPGADELDGTELIPIVQNGVNKIMTYSGLWNKVAADLQEYVEESLETKVDKVEGKELSTNDFDDDYKDKLDHIQAGAEVNVQSDWTAESGDAFILHKPDLSIYATNARVEDIEALIPNAASTSNQLADKSFVNSSIATNTAEFKGTYDTLEELMTVVANLNDYGFVRNIDSVGNVTFDRYKYTSNNTWLYEYSLNNSSFTQAQWDAINSGITAALVTKLNGIESAAQVNIIEGVQVDGSDLPITNKKVNIVLSGKVDKVAGKGLSTNDYTNSEKLKLGAFPAWSEVETSINSKVDKSGSESKDEIFTYQQTGGGLTKNAKNARVVSYKGKTLAWNQHIRPSDIRPTLTDEGVTYTNNGDGTVSMVGTAIKTTSIALCINIADKPVIGHKIYKTAGSKAVNINSYSVPSIVITAQDDTAYYIAIRVQPITYNIILKPKAIDLTLLYGSEIDGLTDAQILAKFESEFPGYHDYNSGTLISNEAKEIESVGFNLWDEEWENGRININTGENSSSNGMRSKNYIPAIAGETYYFKKGAGYTSAYVLFYDGNNGYIGYHDATSVLQFSVPSGASFMRFYIPTDGAVTTYNNDICINLSDTNRNGTYEPYKKYSHKINLDSFKVTDGTNVYTINGLKSAGNVYDEIVEGKYIKRVGGVDLGDLSWSVQGDGADGGKVFRTQSLTGFALSAPTCSRYIGIVISSWSQTLKESVNAYSSGFLMLGSSSHTTAPTSSDNWLSGVILYYELATPEVYDLVLPISTDYPVDKLGTERVISDNICPIRVSTEYHEANISDIQVEGITDYLKKAELKKELNTELTKLEGIEEGAQVNVIEGVQVNGSDLPVSNKKVNIDLSGIEGWSPVIAAAFAKLQSEIDSLKELLNDYQLKVKAESVDVLEYKIAGMPRILYSSTAGAPSASNVPDNWDESTMNGWSGVPRFIGQLYLDKPGKKVYFAAAVTNSTGDWVVLN